MVPFQTSKFPPIALVLFMQWSICFSSYDSTVGNAVMPLDNDAMAVAYDANNDTILLVGGYGDDLYHRQFTTFKNNVFTLINQYYLSESQQTWSYSQHYTTLDDELWMIRTDGTGFTTFNINTYKVDAPSITIPTDVNYGGCLVSIPNYLIVLGGYEEDEDTGLKDTQIYDINEDMWLLNVPNMSQKRGSFSCVVVNNNVYAIGGYSYPDFFDIIEVLDISNIDSVQSNEWRYLSATLSEALSGTRAVQYHTDIIVIGGQDEGKKRVTDVHRIDTLRETCELVGDLDVKIQDVTCIIVENTLHIFGGWKGGISDAIDTYQYITLLTFSPTIHPTTNPTHIPTPNPTSEPTILTYAPTEMPSHSPILSTIDNNEQQNANHTQNNHKDNRFQIKSFVISVYGILCIVGIIGLIVCVVIACCCTKRTVKSQSDIQYLRKDDSLNQNQIVNASNSSNHQDIELQREGDSGSECGAPPIPPVPGDSDSDDIVLQGGSITGGAPLVHVNHDDEIVPCAPLPPTDNGNVVVHDGVNLIGINTLR